MSRSLRHLFGSARRGWQLVTLSAPAANQALPSAARRCCPSIPATLGAGACRPGPSVRLLHATRQLCSEAPSPQGDNDGTATEYLVTNGPDGEATLEADADQDDGLPDLDLGKTFIAPASTDNLVFGGIPYYELPVIHIKATYNNTHVNITDHTGRKSFTRTTCGAEGFKNAKKGTTVAAQTVGIAAAKKAIDKGLKTVRVIVKGIGPGRQASIKGLQMGGLDIVSITDNTPVPHNGARPRKARRL